MAGRPRVTAVDYLVLAENLAALGYPMRLELLDELRFPKALGEIVVTPTREDVGTNPARPAAKQTVSYHLDKLIEAELVKEERSLEGGRASVRYQVDAGRLYAVTEELRRLSTFYAGRGPTGDATGTLQGPAEAPMLSGPRLVLVHGVYEGKAFALEPMAAVDGRWTIGRKRGLPITLDYDPWASLENAAIVPDGAGHAIVDLGSKNGTFVGWARLADGPRKLRSGDVIGIGRSLLVYVQD